MPESPGTFARGQDRAAVRWTASLIPRYPDGKEVPSGTPMRPWILAPRRSLQVRILASVLLGLGIVVLGLAALVFKITDESTRHALSERLALTQTIQQAVDREILTALRFGENLAAIPGIRSDHDLLRLINISDFLDAATVVGTNGTVLLAARRHGASQVWPASVLQGTVDARIFPILGEKPGVGLAVPIAPGRLLLAQINRSRLLRLLESQPGEGEYAAQLIGADGSQIAVTALPAEAIRRHIALVEPLRTHAEAGIVMHALPDHRFDHYIAYAPLATLPGWGVTVEQPRDVVVALPLRLRTLTLTVGLLMLLVGGAVAWLDVRRVVTPLRVLASEAKRIGTGDLVTPIKVHGQDEIGVLAESLDRMRKDLGDSLDEIRRREARARALHEVATGILRIQERQEALDLVVGEACRLLAGDVALLCLYDAHAQRVRPAAVAGDNEAVFIREAPAGPPPDLGGCAILSRDYREGHLVAPVSAGENLLGWLCVGTRIVRTFTAEDRTLLQSLGTLAALVLENFRLRAEVQSLGAIKERERLARELHDGLAQSLGMVYAHARSGANDGATRRSLDRIAELSARAYEEVRQAIFGLRLAHGANLATALGEYLREFTRQTGLSVDLAIENDQAAALALEAEVQVVRIIQEALANVWRHARATRAVVRFAIEGDEVVVAIEDDGLGFTVEDVEKGQRHFGLLTMRERAESIGGTLSIASAPGGGTRVTARLPRERKEVPPWTRSG